MLGPLASACGRAMGSRGGGRQLPNILVCGTPGTGKSTLCEELLGRLSAEGGPGRAAGPLFSVVKVGEAVLERRLYAEWDDDLDVPIVDDDLLNEWLEPLLAAGGGGGGGADVGGGGGSQLGAAGDGGDGPLGGAGAGCAVSSAAGCAAAAGGHLVDFHDPGSFDPAWFDLIILLRADTSVLWRRLEARGYAQAKIKENVESEIFQVVKDAVLEMRGDREDGDGDEGGGNVLPIVEAENNTVEQMESTVKTVLDFVRAFVERGADVAAAPLSANEPPPPAAFAVEYEK